ncbi:flavodoxin family protein, partial [Komagataeibacter kakiaceti]
MSKVIVVYHSVYGHTKVVAEHVARGAEARLVAIDANGDISDAEWTALNEADAIIMGSPTYMGNVSWQYKKFADATSKIWFTRGWQDKVFGGFTNSASPNGDKQVALITLQTLASQHGGIWVSLGVPPSNTKAA